MKRTTIAAVAAVLLLALTGCAETAGNASDERVAPAAAESTEPLAAETPTDVPVDEADAAFLQYVEDELPPTTSIADAADEQLIAAGHEACEQAEAGVAWEDIRLVEGEEPTPTGDYLDSSAILNGALYNYCPELIPAVD